MKFVVEAIGLTTGGGKASLLRLLPSLARQTPHQFVILLPDSPEYASINAPALKLILQTKPKSLLLRHLYLNRSVPKICVEEQADGLLCLGNFAPQRPPVPTVLFVRNAWYLYRDKTAYRRATLRERLIVRYAWHHFHRLSESVQVVVQTEVMKQRMVALYHLDPSRVAVIPDTDGLPPLPDQQGEPRKDGSARPFTFLCLARYYAHKNLEILVDAAKRLPAYSRRPAQCFITISADQHPGARKLLKRIAREKLEHILVNVGPIPRMRVPEVYRSADAFVLPTLLESFGRIYLEAMLFGLPILTSDRDFARDRCGDAALYFDPLDADSVAKSMARLMEEDALRRELVSNAAPLVKQAPTWDEIASQFVAVLERAANG